MNIIALGLASWTMSGLECNREFTFAELGRTESLKALSCNALKR